MALEDGGWLGGSDDRKQENRKRAVSLVQLSFTKLSKNSVCNDEEAEAGAAKSVLFFFPIDLYNSCTQIVLK